MMKQRVILFNNNDYHILCVIVQFPSITGIDKLKLNTKMCISTETVQDMCSPRILFGISQIK